MKNFLNLFPLIFIRSAARRFAAYAALLLLTALVSTGAARAASPVPAPPTHGFVQISAGGEHVCGILYDSSLHCWGRNEDGEATPPSGTFMQVSAGWAYTCALASDNTVQCWGRNEYGQATAPAGTYLQVSAGTYHTCGVRTDHTVHCWGNNFDHQSDDPVGTYLQVEATGYYSCALRTDGTVHCWGQGEYGPIDTDPPGTYTQISIGGYMRCGIQGDDGVHCWGYDYDYPPQDLQGNFYQVSLGEGQRCALRRDGVLFCWGHNEHGEATPPSGLFEKVSAGLWFTCAIRSDFTVTCWGSNAHGQTSPIEITPPALNPAIAGVKFVQKLTASGGTPPYTFRELNQLPSGMYLNMDGTVHGKTEVGGVWNVRIEVNDALGVPGHRDYVLDICGTTPPAPHLILPADHATVSPEAVELVWSKTACTKNYRVVVKREPRGAVVFRKTVTTHRVMISEFGDIPTGYTPAQFTWFVRACNPTGCTRSDVRTFLR